MPIEHSIWSLEPQQKLHSSQCLKENELEDLIYNHIEFLNENWVVVGRQIVMGSARLDILCIDRSGKLIIIELKRGLTPREVVAQTLDYASIVSKWNYDEFKKFINNGHCPLDLDDIDKTLTKECDTDVTKEFNTKDVQMVIVATEMDNTTERVIDYLQKYGVEINVLFFSPYEVDGKRYLSRSWLTEPDTIDKIQIAKDWNGEVYLNYGAKEGSRSWEDAKEFGFVSAGGGKVYTQTFRKLNVNERIWVKIPDRGYVGVGILESEPESIYTATLKDKNGQEVPFRSLVKGIYHVDGDEDNLEYIAKVKWIKAVDLEDAVREPGLFGNQNVVSRPTVKKWEDTVQRLKQKWGLND